MWTSADDLAEATMQGRYHSGTCERCGRRNGFTVARKGDEPPADAFRCKRTLNRGGEVLTMCDDEWEALRQTLHAGTTINHGHEAKRLSKGSLVAHLVMMHGSVMPTGILRTWRVDELENDHREAHERQESNAT